ncbi:MAG: hypothetical protein JNM56_03750 [Planctomycetia bacterium]|nr:hypothetical protein [Planctomycetia bacterium]
MSPSWPPTAVCSAVEVAAVERQLASDPNNVGIGVIDLTSGQIRLFSYDETDAFSLAHPQMQVAAGHEAAAAMADFAATAVRGFVLGKMGGDWHVFNQSHLNRPDGQTRTMRMADQTFNAIVSALQQAGAVNPVCH